MHAEGGEAQDVGAVSEAACQRLTLLKVGPHGPQLALRPDVADHDEQRVFPRVPARRCYRGSSLAPRLRGVLSRRRAGASEPQSRSRLHSNAARPRGPGFGLHGNRGGVRGRLRPQRGERAPLLKAGAGAAHWSLPVRGGAIAVGGGAWLAGCRLCGARPGRGRVGPRLPGGATRAKKLLLVGCVPERRRLGLRGFAAWGAILRGLGSHLVPVCLLCDCASSGAVFFSLSLAAKALPQPRCPFPRPRPSCAQGASAVPKGTE